MVNKFDEGRVFVAGGEITHLTGALERRSRALTDAAHVHTPAGGQVGPRFDSLYAAMH